VADTEDALRNRHTYTVCQIERILGPYLNGAQRASVCEAATHPSASLAVTGAAAYLGGHLVFAKAVMVSRVAGADGPRRWVKVVEETELPDDVPTGVLAEGRQVLLYRHDGTLYALDNLCSHAAGLLSRGTVEGLTVTCPLHGSQYCLADGSVRRGPSHQPQPVIRTRARNGWIEVRGNQPAPRRRANGRK